MDFKKITPKVLQCKSFLRISLSAFWIHKTYCREAKVTSWCLHILHDEQRSLKCLLHILKVHWLCLPHQNCLAGIRTPQHSERPLNKGLLESSVYDSSNIILCSTSRMTIWRFSITSAMRSKACCRLSCSADSNCSAICVKAEK